jgi:hypothetical protein
MADLWRWTVVPGQALFIINGQADYELDPEVTDCLYPVYASFWQGQEKHDLNVTPFFREISLSGRPSTLFLWTPGVVRLDPTPTGYPTTPQPVAKWWYKKKATAVGAGNVASEYSTLGIPDEWFWVYQ